MQNKKILAVIILFLFLIGGGAVTSLIFSGTANVQNQMPTITLDEDSIEVLVDDDATVVSNDVLVFYTTTCPFCDNLLKYLKENSQKIDLNIILAKIDDPATDKANLELVLKKLEECNITDG